MAKESKRFKAIHAKADRTKLHPVDEAFKLVKETATAKFDESVDVAINLGIDAKKSDQTVRGSVVLPKNGSGPVDGRSDRVFSRAHGRYGMSGSLPLCFPPLSAMLMLWPIPPRLPSGVQSPERSGAFAEAPCPWAGAAAAGARSTSEKVTMPTPSAARIVNVFRME